MLAEIGRFFRFLRQWANLATAVGTLLLWWWTTDYIRTTSLMYEAQQAPLLVVDAAPLVVDQAKRQIGFRIVLNNFGTGVAYDSKADCASIVNGARIAAQHATDEPMITGPHQSVTVTWGFQGDPAYSALMDGSWTCEQECNIDYLDFAGRSSTCEADSSSCRLRLIHCPQN